MTSKHSSEPFWINEPDWLCAVEFLNDEDTEGRDLAVDPVEPIRTVARDARKPGHTALPKNFLLSATRRNSRERSYRRICVQRP